VDIESVVNIPSTNFEPGLTESLKFKESFISYAISGRASRKWHTSGQNFTS